MIVSIYDSNAIHGITIFDKEGEPIRFVMEFDTETYLCKLNGGGRTVAAGFVIPCNGNKSLKRFLGTLPDVLHQFIVFNEDADELEVLTQNHIEYQLAHRQALREGARAAGMTIDDTTLGNHLT